MDGSLMNRYNTGVSLYSRKQKSQMILPGCVLLKTQQSLIGGSVKLMIYW